MDKLIANRYQLLESVGQGGMADVYKAMDTILNRIVAIKILRGELADDPMTLLRFQREASAASKLSHPNVVDVYDVGESDGRHYIVMEYVRGRTLKQLIAQRGALNLDEAIDIMMQLTSAISLAHEKHIIHRDIKPQNILVKDDGTVKITDFGIAIAHDSIQLTQNHTVMGSAHYLAPETTKGEAPTSAVDIYALGIVFYELLSGKVPFNGTNPTEIAVKHLREKMPYIRDFNPTIPQSVENVILKATAKRVDQRYQSVDEMIDDLAHCRLAEYANVDRLELDDDPVFAVKVQDGHLHVETNQPKKKHRTVIAAAIASLAAVIILLSAVLTASGVISMDHLLGTPIPQVVDLSVQDAIELLNEEGIELRHLHEIRKKSGTMDETDLQTIEILFESFEDNLMQLEYSGDYFLSLPVSNSFIRELKKMPEGLDKFETAFFSKMALKDLTAAAKSEEREYQEFCLDDLRRYHREDFEALRDFVAGYFQGRQIDAEKIADRLDRGIADNFILPLYGEERLAPDTLERALAGFAKDKNMTETDRKFLRSIGKYHASRLQKSHVGFPALKGEFISEACAYWDIKRTRNNMKKILSGADAVYQEQLPKYRLYKKFRDAERHSVKGSILTMQMMGMFKSARNR